MVLINYRTASAAVLLLSIQLVLVQTFDQIASIFLGRVTDTVNTIISNGGLPVLQSRATRTLDNFKTVRISKKQRKYEISHFEMIIILNLFFLG